MVVTPKCGDSRTSESFVKLLTNQQNAHYVVVTSQPITEDAQAVHLLKKSNPIRNNMKQVPSNINSFSNMNTQPKKSYAQATTTDLSSQDVLPNTPQIPDHLFHQMALFLNNFQVTINLLIPLLYLDTKINAV